MAIDANINRIKFLRTKTAGSVPSASLLDEGELAINLVDRTIYSKNGSSVVELGFGKGGSVSGAITAPQFNGPLAGNASTATKLQTARTISLTGSATGSISFDGTSNQSISVNVNAVDALATYAKSNSDSPTKWAQGVQSVFVSSTQGWPMSYGGVITARPHANGGGTLQILTAYGSDAGVGGGEIKIRTGDYSGTGNDTWTSWKTLVHSENVNDYSPTKTGTGASGTWGISVTGNAGSATVLQTARTIGGVSFNGSANINLPGVNTTGNQSTTGSAASLTTARSFSWTGDATGSLSFNGSANVSAVLTLANSGVSAGTYKSVTVDTKGRVTAGTNVITGLVTSTAASGTTNAATSNTNTYLNIVETIGSAATTVGTSTQVTGAGTVTVTSDTAGKLTITGSQTITGNAGSATVLQTARTIGGVSFNGSANINLPGVNTAGNQNTSGNAATATALQTARYINGVLFNGTSDIDIQHVAVRIPGSSNLNNYQTPGIYYCDTDAEAASTVNTPINFSYSLIVTRTAGIVQTFTAYNGGNNDVYVRGFYASSWTPWKKLAFTNDNITGNAGSATALQTARTINGVSFNGTTNITVYDATKLPTAGGTITGNLTVNGSLSITSFHSASPYSFLNGGNAQRIMTGGVLASASYADLSKVPSNGIYALGQIRSDGGFVGNLSGNASTASSATKLATAHTINGVAFNGTANITIADSTKLPLSGGTITGSLNVSGTLNADIKPLLNASGAAPVFGVRAWASIQGRTGDMFAQGNVLSVQRTSQGKYNIRFITPMPHANYAISCAAMSVSSDTRVIFAFKDKTAAGFSLEVVAINPGWHDFTDSGDVTITITC